MNDTQIIRRLVLAAYELGWLDACSDHVSQEVDPGHPIGTSRRMEAVAVLKALDPNDVVGLRNEHDRR